MTDLQDWQYTTNSEQSTIHLGTVFGKLCKGGECIVLSSDLGGGKTTFVRGIAKGLGSSDTVHSPSFTITNEYRARNITLFHYDFYRLSDPGIMRDELSEALTSDKAVIVIEWADIVTDVLPADYATIAIKAISETERLFTISVPKGLQYLIPN